MSLVKKSLLAVAAVSSVIALAIVGLLQGWHVKKYHYHQLGDLLSAHWQVYKPPGDGPFPTIVGFHGCRGIKTGSVAWMKRFVEQGYAGVMVDSFAIRHVHGNDVCSGRALWGMERSGDLVAALEKIKQLPFVAHQNMVLMGWSHGGWTIMDTLALDPPRRLPSSLYDSPLEPLAGVQGIVLMYPYCEFPAKAQGRGWGRDIPTLLIMAGKDTTVSTPACQIIADGLAYQKKSILSHVYPEAVHAFDLQDANGQYPPSETPDIIDVRKRVNAFLASRFNSALEATID